MFLALKKLTVWWYETDWAFNDCSNLSMSMKDQGMGEGGLEKRKDVPSFWRMQKQTS